MKKILIITVQFPPLHGGIGKTVHRVISQLSTEYEVSLLLPEPNSYYAQIISAECKKSNINVIYIPSIKIPRLFKKIFGNKISSITYYPRNHKIFDIDELIQSISPEYLLIFDPLAISGFPLYFGYGKPVGKKFFEQYPDKTMVYYHSHYIGGVDYYGKLFSFLIKRLVKTTTKSILINYPKITVFSTYMKDQLQKIGINNTEIVKFEGIDIDNISQFKLKRDNSKKIRIIYFGRFMKEKNIRMMADILLKLHSLRPKEFTVTMIGDGPERFRIEELSQLIDIEIKDWIEDDTLFSYVINSDIFLNCSDFETLGLSLAESMFFGCIPLAYFRGGHTDLINNGKNGFLCKEVMDYINSIIMIMDNEKIKVEMSKLARMEIIDHFSIKKNISLLLNNLQ